MTRAGVATLASTVVLFIGLLIPPSVALVTSGGLVASLLGVTLLLLSLLGLATLAFELRFGIGAEHLGRRLGAEGGLPTELVGLFPSGRIRRAEASRLFPRYRTAAEAAPADWQAWYRLGLAYDAAGDRRRARAAIRKAIRLEKIGRRTPRSRTVQDDAVKLTD